MPAENSELNQSAALDALTDEEILRRFEVLEALVDAAAQSREKLTNDMQVFSNELACIQRNTSELVAMWKDATLFFGAMRRAGNIVRAFGNAVVWFGGVAGTLIAAYLLLKSESLQAFANFWSSLK